MASGNLYDTNVIVRILNGDRQVADKASLLSNLFVSSIVIGELVFGAEKSAKREANLKTALGFCSRYPRLDTSTDVALAYGKIKNQLKKIGKPIPENDMWIAATAIANNLAVVTDDAHFNNVSNLEIVRI